MNHEEIAAKLDKQLLNLAVAVGSEFAELCDEQEEGFSPEALVMERFMEQVDAVVVARGLEDRFLELV